MSDGLEELARVYVVEALAKWLPQVAVTDVMLTKEDSKTRIHVRYTAQGLVDEIGFEVNHGRQ